MTDDGITLIDVWELPEDRIDESVARWRERVALIRTAPGFRDARMHRRLDPEARLGLVNVAHWDSIEARDEALANPGFTASVRPPRRTMPPCEAAGIG
ncbi:antibiotic biosynthesis monooxygenase family protein [Nocardia xishanensis]|uniref:antibiotic biosynthesis monooxygenase family protein n=1 Tax=Nocardia xishanensis TaxID=238964 RepID=UPI000B30C4FC|nr:antibiotic biosynthesis monooxygenase [Nocardia xishanensis]